MSNVSTWTVSGMTCGHCVASVSEEIAEIDGVSDVSVELGNGTVTVISAGPLERAEVDAAVTEAGYVLT